MTIALTIKSGLYIEKTNPWLICIVYKSWKHIAKYGR